MNPPAASRDSLSNARLLACLFGCLMAAGAAAADRPRYIAVWLDGKQGVAAEVHDWGHSDSRPSLGGRALFDLKTPVRLLADTTIARGKLAAEFIAFRNGDRVPGRVIRFVDADPATGAPAHLIIEPGVELGMGDALSRSQVRVLPKWVRQIVPQPEPGVDIAPKSLTALDGTMETFRDARWRGDGIQVLTDSGVRSYPFAGISAVDFGPWPGWEPWQRQLARLNPGLSSSIVRMELDDGTRLTTSLECLRPTSQGGNDPGKWIHLLQPPWSLDLLAVAHRRVRLRTFFGPMEAPLSAVEPIASRHRAIVSAAWNAARPDANVRGEPLRTGGREYTWGFGVQAHHELEFDLPRSARAFRTKIALDQRAGYGGCARGLVRIGEEALFTSPVLTGSGQPLESGELPLDPARGRLVLIAEAEPPDRPRGADPFDILDVFDWLEPLVEFTPAALQREVDAYALSGHPQLADWTAEPTESGNWRLVNRYNDTDHAHPGFRQVFALSGPLTLARRINVEATRKTFQLQLGRLGEESGQVRFEVWINGARLLRETPVPTDATEEPLRFQIPLKEVAGTSIDVTVRMIPVGESAQVEWRGAALIRDAAGGS
jgi:hypothetical protein